MLTGFDYNLQIEFRTPNRREYLPRTLEPEVYRFTSNRPWTDEWKRQNDSQRFPVCVEPIKDWNFFRGDKVEVLVGRDRGKHGIISQVCHCQDKLQDS